MDRIRYTLTPGFRFESSSWLIKGALHHECIHMINRPEIKGSIWWNSFQVGVGSKGSYYLYLPAQYITKNNTFINKWDAQLNVGYYIPAKNTLLSGQNHEYQYELFSLIRYHLGAFRKWVFFCSLRQHVWTVIDKSPEHQVNITVNAFRKGTINFAQIVL